MDEFFDERFSEIYDIFQALYGSALGFVHIKSKNGKFNNFYQADELMDPYRLNEILQSLYNASYFENVFSSISTYRSIRKRGKKSDIMAQTAIVLDINYPFAYGQAKIPLADAIQAFNLAVLNGFPQPTYIEYSQNFRAVYILDHPYVIKKGKSPVCQQFLELVANSLAEELNKHDELLYFNATPQPLSGFVHIPFSIDVYKEWEQSYDPETKTTNVSLKSFSRKSVEFQWIGTVWNIDKLAELVLPPRFDGYEEWKKNRKVMSAEEKKKYQAQALDRLRHLEILQKRGYETGRQEKMCYFYLLFAMQAGFSYNEARNLVYKYNDNFLNPFSRRYLIQYCRPKDYFDLSLKCKRKGYERRYRNETIRKALDLGELEPDLFPGDGLTTKERNHIYYEKRRAAQVAAGTTKKCDIERKTKIAVEERQKGKKWKEIAALIGVSQSTAMRYYYSYQKAEKEKKEKENKEAEKTKKEEKNKPAKKDSEAFEKKKEKKKIRFSRSKFLKRRMEKESLFTFYQPERMKRKLEKAFLNISKMADLALLCQDSGSLFVASG